MGETVDLFLRAWAERDDEAESSNEALIADARALCQSLAASARSIDDSLREESERVADYRAALEAERSRPLKERLAEDPQITDEIRSARLAVGSQLLAEALHRELRGDAGSAAKLAKEGLEVCLRLDLTIDAEDVLPRLTGVRLISVYVQALCSLKREPPVDGFVDEFLLQFTDSVRASWEHWLLQDGECAHWVIDRLSNWSSGWSDDRIWADRLTTDLLVRVGAMGGLVESHARAGRTGAAATPRSRVRADEVDVAEILRNVKALHARFDGQVDLMLEVKYDHRRLKEIFEASAVRRRDAAQAFLRAIIADWDALRDETRKDLLWGEVSYRTLAAGEVDEAVARQIANSFGVAFEREQRGNPGAALPNSGAFWDLRHLAAHPDEGGFGSVELEHMRSYLFGIGTGTHGIMALLAAAARQKKRR